MIKHSGINDFFMKLSVTYLSMLCCVGFLLGPVELRAQRSSSVAAFALPGEFDGETVSLASFSDNKAIVVAFTSYHCSWSVKYMDRLTQLYQEYHPRNVAFIAINSNDPELEGELVRIAPPGFPFLKDADQTVARDFGATRNPEAFVLIPAGAHFKIVYQGKIDDNPLDARLVRHNFLQDALDQILAGQNVHTRRTPASGCSIKGLD